jgi:hypothetical protein
MPPGVFFLRSFSEGQRHEHFGSVTGKNLAVVERVIAVAPVRPKRLTLAAQREPV